MCHKSLFSHIRDGCLHLRRHGGDHGHRTRRLLRVLLHGTATSKLLHGADGSKRRKPPAGEQLKKQNQEREWDLLWDGEENDT